MTLEPQVLQIEDSEEIKLKKINVYLNREKLLISRAKQTDQSMEDIVISLAMTMERRYRLEGNETRIQFISSEIAKQFELKDIPYANSVRRALIQYPTYKLSTKSRLSRLTQANAEIENLSASELEARMAAEADKMKKSFDQLKKSKNIIKAIERRVDIENLDINVYKRNQYSTYDTIQETKKRITTSNGLVGPSRTHAALGELIKMYIEIQNNVWNNSPAASPQLDAEFEFCIKNYMKFMQPFRSQKFCGDNYSYLHLAKMRSRVTKYKAARMHEVPTNLCVKCSTPELDEFVEMDFVPFGEIYDEEQNLVIEKKNFYQCPKCKGDKAIIHRMSYENVNSRADETINMLDQALVNNQLFFALTKWLRKFQWQKNAAVKEMSQDQWNHAR